mgnify:CR=1 FL=1
MSTPESRLDELGIELPEPMKPVATYVPFVISGNMLFVSGQVSASSDGLIKGRLGENRGGCEGMQGTRERGS